VIIEGRDLMLSFGETPDGSGGCRAPDQFGGEAIDRIDVAATGPNAPVPPLRRSR
jgi:hypothetical protein